MSEHYRVVFTGKVEPGKDVEQVIDRFSEKFKLERKMAEKVIRAGRPVSLKKELPLDKAEKYVKVLQLIGIEVEIDPKPPVPEPAPALSGFELEPLDHGGGDTTEVLDQSPDVGRCPKCGSTRMEMGICQDCGIVATKYLAAKAQRGEESDAGSANPYSAPEADLEEPMEDHMRGPVGVPAGNGVTWIGKGWWHFKSSPLAWIGAIVVFFVISLVLAFIPFFGSIVSTLISPVIMAGFMYGCAEQDQGGDFSVSHLFAGFSSNVGQLMLVAVFYFVMMIVVGIVMVGGMFMLMGGMAGLENPETMAMADPGPILGIVGLGLLLFIPVIMAYLFAPALVILDDLTALEAMKYSFIGCWKNMLPMFVFGLVAMVLLFVGTLPMLLGLLVVAPILTASVYAAYRDIYFG
ncbi:MAG: BPSS1780 family membrane protein [Candidatus Thiodiazotropha sp.]